MGEILIGDIAAALARDGLIVACDRTARDWHSDIFFFTPREDFVVTDLAAFNAKCQRTFMRGAAYRGEILQRPALTVNLTDRCTLPRRLAIDVDAKRGTAKPTEEGWAALVDELDGVFEPYWEHMVDVSTVTIVAAWPADKGGKLGFHLFFPDVLMARAGEKPARFPEGFKKALEDAVERVLGVQVAVDQPSGLRIGPSDKPLGEGRWRGSAPTIVYSTVPNLQFAELNPLCERGCALPMLKWKATEKRQRTQRIQRGPAMDLTDMDEVAQRVFAFYRLYYDEDARFQSGFPYRDNGRLKFRFIDSKKHKCVHASNNHEACFQDGRLEVSCMGPDQALTKKVHTWAEIERAAALAEELLPQPMDDAEDEDEDPIAALLQLVVEEPNLDLHHPIFADEFRYLRMDAPAYALEYHGDGIAITPALFDQLRDSGLGDEQLGNLLSLCVVHVNDKGWMIRDGLGRIRVASPQTVRTIFGKRYSVFVQQKRGEPKRVAFPWETHVRHVTSSEYVRWDKPVKAHHMPVRIMPAVIPSYPEWDAAPGEARKMSLWWHVYMTTLASDTRGGDCKLLTQWLRAWAGETLFGYRPIGVLPVIVEADGGSGKSFLGELMTRILGQHQVQVFTNIKKDLSTFFNAQLAVKRLIIIDDASSKEFDGNMLKAFITQRQASVNVKFGENGVTEDIDMAKLLLTNWLGKVPPELFTRIERRIVMVCPGRVPKANYPAEIYDECARLFGTTLRSFLDVAHDFTDHDIQVLCDVLRELYLRDVADVGGDLLRWLRETLEDGALMNDTYMQARLEAAGPVGQWIYSVCSAGKALLDEGNRYFTWPNLRDHSPIYVPKSTKRVAGVTEGQTLMEFYASSALYKIYSMTDGTTRMTQHEFNRQFQDDFTSICRMLTGETARAFAEPARRVCVSMAPQFINEQGVPRFEGLNADARDGDGVQQRGWTLSFDAFLKINN